MKLYGSESFFTTQEFACKCGCGFGTQEKDISEKLIRFLNEMRVLFDAPMTISSGARCTAYNLSIGGAPNSAHLPNPETHQCEAADISLVGGHSRCLLVKLAIYCGFRRIGVDKNFVHVDVARHLLTETMWTY